MINLARAPAIASGGGAARRPDIRCPRRAGTAPPPRPRHPLFPRYEAVRRTRSPPAQSRQVCASPLAQKNLGKSTFPACLSSTAERVHLDECKNSQLRKGVVCSFIFSRWRAETKRALLQARGAVMGLGRLDQKEMTMRGTLRAAL